MCVESNGLHLFVSVRSNSFFFSSSSSYYHQLKQQQQQQQISRRLRKTNKLTNLNPSHPNHLFIKCSRNLLKQFKFVKSQFGTLCELDDVKEIISMDRMPLTVFAPIDRSLSDVLAKAKSRSINLIELAKHHIGKYSPSSSPSSSA